MPKILKIVTVNLLLLYCLNLKSQVAQTAAIDYNVTVKFQSDTQINFDLNIHINPRDTIKLFFKNHYVDGFKSQNRDLKLIISDSLYGKTIKAYTINRKKTTDLYLKYELKIPDSIKSRNFLLESDQLLLLPDFDYLPNVLPANERVVYRLDIQGNDKYAYSNDDYKSDPYKLPYILSGNFKIKSESRIRSFIPNDIPYDEKRYLSILKTVLSAYDYFSRIYGSPDDKKAFDVFFLNRSGGHSFSSGLILYQNYLQGSQKLNNKLKLLIAHEVAHYWWGNSIETNQSSLFEGISEYSALLYMEDVEQYEIKDSYADKNFQLEMHPIAKVKFDTITPYHFQNDLYRTFSYVKLPILLRALGSRIGKDNLTQELKNLFVKYRSLGRMVTYSDFIDSFKTYGANGDLENEILGIETKWTDYYIKSVNDNVVTYGIEGLHKKDRIAVALTNDRNEIIQDTISFDKNNELIKKYDFTVNRIQIDPAFQTSQETAINDCYNVKMLNTSTSKYGKIYEGKYYTLADSLTTFLFYNDLTLQTFVTGKELQSKLLNIANSTRKIKVKGLFMFMDKKNNKLKIKVAFATSSKQNLLGFMEFSYIEKDNAVYLTAIDRINL